MTKDEVQPDYTFDIDDVPTTTEITDMHQEGNWLIGVTATGTKFRHHIPVDKMLVKKDGKWGLETVNIQA